MARPAEKSFRKSGSPRPLLWMAALAVALVFIGYDSSRLSAPFGPSHDGFNAALYMSGGRAIVQEGWFASRIGATARTVSGNRVVYAHHPPLVYVEDAAAAAALGTTETAARLPAIVSSLVVLLLVVFVLASCGLRAGAAAAGLLVAFATPMFLMFGAMTEPHALGLAPMTALTLLWNRARRGADRPVWALASVAAVATFTSWQAGLFAVAVGAALLLVDRRGSAAIAVLVGTAGAALLIAVWILWAYDGDPRDFINRAIHRLGAGTVGRVTFEQMARQQRQFFADLFPVGGWFVVPVAALGLFDGRTRSLVAVSLGTVLGYAVLFKNGAYDHNYWLYCILLPLALGGAAGAEAAAQLLSRRPSLRAVPLALGVALVVLLGLTLWRPSNEQRQRHGAAKMGAQARALQWPARQRYAYHTFGGHGPTDLLPWLSFYSQREPFGVDGPQSVPYGEIFLRSVDGRLIAVPGEQVSEP